jgi:hypothetical protein
MSKKNRNRSQFNTSAPAASAQTSTALTEEYRIIKHDLVRVVILNALFLAGILALYYTNAKTHYLEQWFNQIFNAAL